MHVTSFRKSLPRTLCFIRVSAIPHACHVDPEKHPRNLMFHKGLSNIYDIEFSQRMPLNPAYYSKPELMVFECPRLPVTPYDSACIYTRQIDGFGRPGRSFFVKYAELMVLASKMWLSPYTLTGFWMSGDVYTHSMEFHENFTKTRKGIGSEPHFGDCNFTEKHIHETL